MNHYTKKYFLEILYKNFESRNCYYRIMRLERNGSITNSYVNNSFYIEKTRNNTNTYISLNGLTRKSGMSEDVRALSTIYVHSL